MLACSAHCGPSVDADASVDWDRQSITDNPLIYLISSMTAQLRLPGVQQMMAAFLPLRLEGERPGGVVGVQFFGPYFFFFGDSLSGDGASWVWTERPDGPASLVGRLLRKARMLSWSDLRGERPSIAFTDSVFHSSSCSGVML